jgi:hypothetical protein
VPVPLTVWTAKKVDQRTGGWGRRLGLLVPFLPLLAVVGVLLVAFAPVIPPSAAAGSCGAGTAVPTSADIPPSMMAGINALKADYEAVGADKDVSWVVLAAIDYRESMNDPNRSSLAGEPLGSVNPDHPDIVTTTKRDALGRTADILRSLASSVYGVTVTAATGGLELQEAFVAYGRGNIYKSAGVGPEVSPYVWNQYDAAHADMRWPSISGEPLAGEQEVGRFGAWTIVSRLGGPAGNCGLSDDDIVRMAEGDIGLREVPDGCNCGEQIQKFLGSSSSEAWCADAVSFWYNAAGHPFSGGNDGGWRIAGVSAMKAWLEANGRWFPAGSAEDPRPGDVVVFGDEDHVGIVERLDGDTLETIEGNHGNAVGRGSYPRVGGSVMGWGRMASAA